MTSSCCSPSPRMSPRIVMAPMVVGQRGGTQAREGAGWRGGLSVEEQEGRGEESMAGVRVGWVWGEK